MPSPHAWIRDRDDGAVAVLYAILLVIMLGATALAVDLGALRADRHATQRTADLSSTAGVLSLYSQFGEGSPQDACRAAWEYFLINTLDASPGDNPCDDFVWTCQAGLAASIEDRSVVGLANPYQVTIVWPVLDDDVFMAGDGYNNEIDGEDPCERLGINVTRTRGFLFARVLDPNFAEGATGAFAVARAFVDTLGTEVAAIAVLEREKCRAIFAQGNSRILVSESPDQGDGPGPGIIAVDSAGSVDCQGNKYAIDVDPNACVKAGVVGGSLQAECMAITIRNGMIISYALTAGGAAYLNQPGEPPPERLGPRPNRGPRFTRAPVDHVYNCKSASAYAADPRVLDPIDGCPEADNGVPAHVDELRSPSQIGETIGLRPSGYRDFVAEHASLLKDPCKPSDLVVEAGNWWVNCPGVNNKGFEVDGNVVFLGGNIVFDGRVDVGGHNRLEINRNASSDSIVFIRAGRLWRNAHAEIVLNRTFVYVSNGSVQLAGVGAGDGTKKLVWTAPRTASNPFQALALWSEGLDDHSLGGHVELDIEGIFFAPNAPFFFRGQPTYAGDLEAQFVTRELSTRGFAELIIVPNPEWMIPFPSLSVRLIR
jgi:hypothetical protein